MMKLKLIIWSFFALAINGTMEAQQCGTDYFLEKEYAKNPSFRNVVEQNWIMGDAPASQSEGARAVKIIPIVFHVFHDNAVGNISYEQVVSAVEMLNEDFRRTNADASSTRAIFSQYAADSEIEFRLARIDPDGNCTNGIVRINNPDASYDAGNNVKSLSYWPSNQYFNVWVVNNIESGGVNGIILGYAQFPGSGSWSTYGIVVRNDRVGRVGSAQSGDRTLTHEFGHCFNLLHTFQSGCGSSCQSSGDRVCDTPPVDHSTQGCGTTQNQCSNDVVGNSVYTTDVVDQIENYMSYDDCQNMYSLGQKARMQSALANISVLQQLTSQTNLTAVGAMLPAEGICQAGFEVTSRIVCAGEPVSFIDQSYYNPNSFAWSFNGGYPQNSTSKNPVVVYNTPGTYGVSLVVKDSNNVSASITKTNYITVISSFGKTTPVSESFENGGTLGSMDWFAETLPNGLGWIKNFNGGATGTNSIKANAYAATGDIIIESAAYDISNMTSLVVNFKHAYASRTNGGNSFLRAYFSTDCGQTWKLKWVTAGPSMVTASEMAGPYNSPQSSEWSSNSFTVSSAQMGKSIRLKFEFMSNNGNNLFVDDINITGVNSSKVVLTYPYDGTIGTSASELLNWNASAPANSYTLQLDTSASFNSPLFSQHQIQYFTTESNNTDTEFLTTGLTNGAKYYWRVRAEKTTGPEAWSDVWNFTVNVTGIKNDINIADEVSVLVYPNPSSDVVNIAIDMAKAGDMDVVIYDITGNLVKTVMTGFVPQGKSNFKVQPSSWSRGVYLIQTRTKTSVQTTRFVLN